MITILFADSLESTEEGEERLIFGVKNNTSQ
jgi:hypothetical protein